MIRLLILLITLPFAAVAEGARMDLDCRVTSTCDVDGVCAEADRSVAFTIAPMRTDAAGAGTYDVSSDGRSNPAQALDRTGPFLWQHADRRHILVLTAEDKALYLRQTPVQPASASPVTTVDYLTCEVTF